MPDDRRQGTEGGRRRAEGRRGRKSFSVLCLLFSVLCLLGCGFQPIYGAHGGGSAPAAEQLGQVAIDNIPDRQGQMLRNELIDRMHGKGRPRQPLYRLEVRPRITREDIGIQANATSTRSILNMYADYFLRDMEGQELMRGTAHSITNFNKLNAQYGNLAAEEDATRRTIHEVSEQIVSRLGLHFAESNDGGRRADAR